MENENSGTMRVLLTKKFARILAKDLEEITRPGCSINPVCLTPEQVGSLHALRFLLAAFDDGK